MHAGMGKRVEEPFDYRELPADDFARRGASDRKIGRVPGAQGGAPILSKRISCLDRRAFPRDRHTALFPAVVDQFARVVQVILPEELALGPTSALDQRGESPAIVRQPCDQVGGP
jgi:hypothetical protein